MSIVIKDPTGANRSLATYVATFSAREQGALFPIEYPVAINPNNAEQILQVLREMLYLPKVYQYAKVFLHTNFYPQTLESGADVFIQSVLHAIAGAENMHCLNWDFNWIEYIRASDSLVVAKRTNYFYFLVDNPFMEAFIESYGPYQWDDLISSQFLTAREFEELADTDVAEILSPYYTWFINDDGYEKLCLGLYGLCIKLEKVLGKSFFTWNTEVLKEPVWINLLQESLEENQ